MDNVQKGRKFVNMPSSQAFRFYLNIVKKITVCYILMYLDAVVNLILIFRLFMIFKQLVLDISSLNSCVSLEWSC
jgi:hypothetical protein